MSFQGNNNNGFNSQEIEEFKKVIKENFSKFIPFVIILIIIMGGKSLYYTVGPDEQAVVVRFGKYIGTFEPGLHFKLPFGIDQNVNVKVTRVLKEEFGFRTRDVSTRRTTYSDGGFEEESIMLTGDLNVAEVEWVVQYKISDPFKFLFKTSSPIQNIRDVSESIMRRVVGDRSVTEVLTTGRVAIASEAKILTQEVLNSYNMGVNVISVKLQDINPPEKVKASFNEVNEAKQEQEQMINQAEASYNKVIPKARGEADRKISEAQGYSEALINRAMGDVASFDALQKEYKRAPLITKKRIYLETMEILFQRFENVVVVDSKVKGLMPIFSRGLKGE